MKIKKALIFILVLAIAASFTACKSRTGVKTEKQKGAREVSVSENPRPESESEPEPESEPENDQSFTEARNETDRFLRAAKSGDRAQIQDFADYNTLFGLAEDQNADWIFQQVLMRMQYEINDVTGEGDNATVSAKISNIDMGVVLPEYFRQAMEAQYKSALSDSPMSAEELESEYHRLFAKIASGNSENRVQNQVDIELENKDGKWVIKVDRKLGDALLGGYFGALANISMSSAQPGDETPPDPDAGGDSSDGEGELSMVPPRE